MADTSALKEVSEYAISQVALKLDASLTKKSVVIGTANKLKAFDGVSKDADIVVKILNHSGFTSGGNKPSAKIRSTFADCYFLNLTKARHKILAFTNYEFYKIFSDESGSLLDGIELMFVELPDHYKAIANRVTEQASEEMTKI